jgi:hypothetical protein
MREPAALTVDDVRLAKVSSRRLAPFSKKKLNV